jgi:hypothetical protein
MKKVVFWNVTPCGSFRSRSFGVTYLLHHQSDKNRRAKSNVSSNWQPNHAAKLSPWWWKRYVPPKRRILQEPHCVTSQKTTFFNVVLVRWLISLWRWRRNVPSKRRFLQEPHGVKSQRTTFFIVTTVKTSNLTKLSTTSWGRIGNEFIHPRLIDLDICPMWVGSGTPRPPSSPGEIRQYSLEMRLGELENLLGRPLIQLRPSVVRPITN